MYIAEVSKMIFLINKEKKSLDQVLTEDPTSSIQFKKLGDKHNFFCIWQGKLYYNQNTVKDPVYTESGYECKAGKQGKYIIKTQK